MADDPYSFNRGVIRPMQCLRDGWQLIREQYWLFVGITFVGAMIAQIGPMGILLGPMMCGMYLCIFRRESNKPADFAILFKGFDLFGQSIIPSLVMIVPIFIMVMIWMVFYFVAIFTAVGMLQPRGPQGPPDPAILFGTIGIAYGLLFLIILIGNVYHVFLIFAFPLLVDRKLSGWEACKLSARAVLGNLGGMILLMLLQLLLKLASSVICIIGPILEAPISLAMIAVAYRQIFPMQSALSRFGDEGDFDDERDDDDERESSPRSATPGSTDVRSGEPSARGSDEAQPDPDTAPPPENRPPAGNP